MSGTFGSWLDAQRNRPAGDPVGELARYWSGDGTPGSQGVKGARRIRALPGVQAALRETGALADGSPVLGWWEAAVAAWRGERTPLSVVPGTQPASEPGDSVLAMIQDTLDAHTRFLAAIAARLGMSASEVQRLAAQAGLRPAQPIGWQGLAAAADWEASDEAG